METPTIITSLRSIKGKKVKRLRAKGRMPLHVYGFGIESLSLEAPYKEVMSILKEAGRTTPVVIKIDGEKDIVISTGLSYQWNSRTCRFHES